MVGFVGSVVEHRYTKYQRKPPSYYDFSYEELKEVYQTIKQVAKIFGIEVYPVHNKPMLEEEIIRVAKEINQKFGIEYALTKR